MEMRSKDYVQNLKKRDALLLEMEEENRAFGKTVPADFDAVFRMKRFIYWSDRTTAIETEIEIVDSCLTILKRKIRQAAMDLLRSDDPALSNYRAAHRVKDTLPIKDEADDDDNNHGGIITTREIRKLEEEISGKIDAKVALVKEAAITSDQHRLQESLIIQFDNVTVELDQLCADLRSKRPAAALILPGGSGSCSSQLSAGVVESEYAANDHTTTTPGPGYSIYSHNVCVELDQLCAELRSKRSAAAALNNLPGGSGSQQYSAGVVKSGEADDDTTPGLGSLASKKRKPKDVAVNREGVRRSPRLAKPPLAKCCFC
ncbi:unnamed protein product [Linum trigynum]|uniref:Uncharacterized protein n=1 Tax=Linum trigynum TaxID=586398 RepID=A0AAV2G0M5_9ROSI